MEIKRGRMMNKREEIKRKVYKLENNDNNMIFPSDPQGSLDDYLNQNIYKSIIHFATRMFPSDPQGSLDDYFLKSIFLGGAL